MASAEVPMMGKLCLRAELPAQIQWCLPTKVNDDSPRLFFGKNVQNVFEEKRFEIQLIADVIIGAHRLRVAIDHDGLKALFSQSESRMDATVIELDPLPDPVRATAQNDDFLFPLYP